MSDMRRETGDQRRAADRRQAERESMRTNPEVMGRTEPARVEDEHPHESEQPRTERTMAGTDRPMEHMDFWPHMGDFRRRLDEIQSEFINEPRAAVKKAERLVEEAVDHMAKSMREHVKRMHGDIEGNADTEKLRLMMRSFREFIDSLEKRRAA
jgi:hypothetical protein